MQNGRLTEGLGRKSLFWVTSPTFWIPAYAGMTGKKDQIASSLTLLAMTMDMGSREA